MKQMLIIIGFSLIYPVLDAKRYSLTRYGVSINHSLNVMMYALIIITIIGCILFKTNVKGLEEYVQLVFCILTFRWIVFDISFNKFTGMPINYIGKTSLIDKIFFNIKIGRFIMPVIKSVFLYFTILFLMQWLAR